MVLWVSQIVVFWGITVSLITDLVSAFDIYVAYLVFDVFFRNLDNRLNYKQNIH